MTFPQSPGFKGDLETGRQAARAFAPKAKPIRAQALEIIERRDATAEEIGEAIGVHFMVVRARCSELRAQGLIEDSGQRGAGALGGKVVVWRVTTPVERASFAARREARA